MSRILFVSDVHVRPDSVKRNGRFLDFLRSQGQGVHTLYLLGDIFDYWIGPKHLMGADYHAVLQAFRRLTQAGVQINFIHGNRDFLVDGNFESVTGVRILGPSATVDLGGRHVHLSHGDFIYNRNFKYAAFRRMMRLQTVRRAYVGMPRWLGKVLARGVQNVSRRTTPPAEFSKSDILEGAYEHFRRGVDVLICGHIHRQQHHGLEYRGRRRDVYVLGDWDGDAQEFLEYDGAFRFRPWAS